MQIVSLNPAFTDILCALHDGAKMCGVTHLCAPSAKECNPIVVTTPTATPSNDFERQKLLAGLTNLGIDWSALEKARPSVIVTTVLDDNPPDFIAWAEGYLANVLSRKVRIVSLDIITLDGLFDAYGKLGTLIGSGALGRDRAQRMKSQILDWSRNLYDRVRNKKVVVLSSVSPFAVAGCWIPDVVQLASGRPLHPEHKKLSVPISWDELVAFAPDTILVALQGKTLQESLRTINVLEALDDWDRLPAVKRGEVVFSDGQRLYSAGPKFIEGVGVLISAMAGLDSGYIKKKDEFYRLRFVELHRHRLL